MPKAKIQMEVDQREKLSASIFGSSYNLTMMFFELFDQSPDIAEVVETALKVYKLKIKEGGADE